MFQYGGAFSIPGGAIDFAETPADAANREAHEELEGVPQYSVTHTVVADHGGWAYHTVHADVESKSVPVLSPLSWETDSVGWFTPGEIDKLPLHPDFRIYWESIQRPSFTS